MAISSHQLARPRIDDPWMSQSKISRLPKYTPPEHRYIMAGVVLMAASALAWLWFLAV